MKLRHVQEIFLTIGEIMEIWILIVLIMTHIMMWRILKEIRKIEGKLLHPDQRPKNERHWNWGKKR